MWCRFGFNKWCGATHWWNKHTCHFVVLCCCSLCIWLTFPFFFSFFLGEGGVCFHRRRKVVSTSRTDLVLSCYINRNAMPHRSRARRGTVCEISWRQGNTGRPVSLLRRVCSCVRDNQWRNCRCHRHFRKVRPRAVGCGGDVGKNKFQVSTTTVSQALQLCGLQSCFPIPWLLPVTLA